MLRIIKKIANNAFGRGCAIGLTINLGLISSALATNSPAQVGGEPFDEFLINNQQLVVVPTLGQGYGNDVQIIEIEMAPVELLTIDGSGPSGEVMTWYSAFVEAMPYDNSLELTPQTISDLGDVSAVMSWTVGTLVGPFGTADAVAVAMSVTDINGVRKHFLVPIAQVDPGLVDLLGSIATDLLPPPIALFPGGPPSGSAPAPEFGACDQAYRDALSQALSDFTACMADNVVPIGLPAVSCFVLCLPFLVGSPAAYAICVALCEAGVTAAGIISTIACTTELTAAKAAALDAYCSCIESNGEPDIHGCVEPL